MPSRRESAGSTRHGPPGRWSTGHAGPGQTGHRQAGCCCGGSRRGPLSSERSSLLANCHRDRLPDGTFLTGRRLVAETSGKGLQDETAWVPVPLLPQMGRVNPGKLISLHLSTRSLRTSVVTVCPTLSDGIKRLSTPSERMLWRRQSGRVPRMSVRPWAPQVPSRGHTGTHSERPMPQRDCLGSGWAEQMAGPRSTRPALCPGIAT